MRVLSPQVWHERWGDEAGVIAPADKRPNILILAGEIEMGTKG